MGHVHQRTTAMPNVRELTIALAGGVGSGKSTIARQLADRLDGTVASFGNYVRHLATEIGEVPERSILQRIGQERVEADAHGFVTAFLDWAPLTDNRPFIVDGVRHAAVDAVLRAHSFSMCRDYVLILINVSVRERAERRYHSDESEIYRIDGHPVERETVEKLSNIADAIIDSDGPAKEVMARIAAAVPKSFARRLR